MVSKFIRGILGAGALAIASTGAAQATTVVSDTVGGAGQWGTIQFTHTGGGLNIDGLGNSWTGGVTGTGIDDMYLTLLTDDGSSLTSFTGSLVTANDDSSGTFGDGSTSSLDSYISLANLSAGSYLLAISHCCTAFAGSTNNSSGIHNNYLDFQITFSQDVTVSAVNGISAVPLPAAFPLYGAALAGFAFVGRRKKRKTAA